MTGEGVRDPRVSNSEGRVSGIDMEEGKFIEITNGCDYLVSFNVLKEFPLQFLSYVKKNKLADQNFVFSLTDTAIVDALRGFIGNNEQALKLAKRFADEEYKSPWEFEESDDEDSEEDEDEDSEEDEDEDDDDEYYNYLDANNDDTGRNFTDSCADLLVDYFLRLAPCNDNDVQTDFPKVFMHLKINNNY